MTISKKTTSLGMPWEKEYGYAQAVKLGMPNSSVYAAGKAVLISMAKTLCCEMLSRGIRVNVVS